MTIKSKEIFSITLYMYNLSNVFCNKQNAKNAKASRPLR